MALAGFSKSPISAAASLFVAFAGLPAFAQTATDVAITVGIATDPKTGAPTNTIKADTLTSEGIGITASGAVFAQITRPTADEARPAELDLTITIPANTEFAGITGSTSLSNPVTDGETKEIDCVVPHSHKDADTTITCAITDPFQFQQDAEGGIGAFGTEVDFEIDFTPNVDTDSSGNVVIPATCPDGSAIGTVTVAVATAAPDTDPNTANNTATTIPFTNNGWADTSVTATAPKTANIGDTITMSSTITNNGPCKADKVQIDAESSDGAGVTLLTFKSFSGTACTQLVDSKGAATTDDGSCVIASLAVGANVTLVKQYTVDSTTATNEAQTERTSGITITKQTEDDPNGGNNVADTTTVVGQSNSACSTGGSVGPLALIGLLLVFSRKRRTA